MFHLLCPRLRTFKHLIFSPPATEIHMSLNNQKSWVRPTGDREISVSFWVWLGGEKLPLHLARGTKDPARHPRALHGLRSDEEGWPRDPGRAWAEIALSERSPPSRILFCVLGNQVGPPRVRVSALFPGRWFQPNVVELGAGDHGGWITQVVIARSWLTAPGESVPWPRLCRRSEAGLLLGWLSNWTTGQPSDVLSLPPESWLSWAALRPPVPGSLFLSP